MTKTPSEPRFSTADELLDKFERFYHAKTAPDYLKGNKYWNAFLEIRRLRGPWCNYSKKVCSELIRVDASLAQDILNEPDPN